MDLLKRRLKNKVPVKSKVDIDFLSDKIFHRYTTAFILSLAGLYLI